MPSSSSKTSDTPNITSKSIAFLRNLAKNNDRDWFTAHKPDYELHVRAPVLALTESINTELAKFAVDHVSEPKRAMYRIHRDTRFSKDKMPYKSHQAVMFGHRRLPKNYCAGFYFSVGHDEVEIAGGLYMPEPDQLAAVRNAIIEDTSTWKKLVTDKSLTKLMGPLKGASLARPPKGFDPDHPAIDWVRMKQFYFFSILKPAAATLPDFQKQIVSRFKAMSDFVAYLNAILVKLVADENDVEPAITRPAPMF